MSPARIFSVLPALVAVAVAAVVGFYGCGSGTICLTCGNGGGNNNAKVTVTGNTDTVTENPVTTGDIDVFVYSVDKADYQCPCPLFILNLCQGGTKDGQACAGNTDCPTDGVCANSTCQSGASSGESCSSNADCPVEGVCGVNSSNGKVAVISNGSTQFSVSGLDPGPLLIVFLQDKTGNNADGTINEGDPIAVLDDPNCELDSVDGNITVTLTDVDIDFSNLAGGESETDCTGVSSPPAPGRARARLITQKTSPSTTTTLP